MYKNYAVTSGRQTVAVREATTAQEAILDYLRGLGCRPDELVRMGAEAVAWRGAVYRAAPVDERVA